jgi:hypothetical protein
MNKTILLSLIISLCNITNAQNELSTFSVKGKIALNKGDTTQALDYYIKENKFNPTKPFDNQQALKLFDARNDFKNALLCAEKLLTLGYPFESIISITSISFKASKEWNLLLERKDSLCLTFEKSINKEWISELNKMTYIDQEIRKVYMGSFKDSIRKQKLLFSMNVIDSINFVNLLNYTKSNGFPTYKTVGYAGVNDVWVLLWHHRGTEFDSNPIWKEIKPYIEKELTNENLDKDFLAMFIDHNEIENGRPMIYRSLFGFYRSQPEYDNLTVIDPVNLDLRRKEIGLAPFELWIESLKLPIPSKIRDLHNSK